jgi:hypothetical protein
MKKILYLGIGVLVALGGAWLIYIWWDQFVIIFQGLIGPMIIMAGAIVFIVGLMTPFKEEVDNFDTECSDLDDEIETEKEEETKEEVKA